MTESFISDAAGNRALPRADAAALLPALRIGYEHAALAQLLGDSGVLAVIGFGSDAPAAHGDPRYLHVNLEPVERPAPFEVWRSAAPVAHGRFGEVRFSSNGDYSFAVIQVDEAAHGGIAGAARQAYRALGDWITRSRTPHVLRMWNYLADINAGEGDRERYREFCHGRAEGMRGVFDHGFPAATAIGVRGEQRVLQVYWIGARLRGTALENPRQISAWRYPREYGPSAPTFARAMRAPTTSPQLYLSGTAAIVGHRSHHGEDLPAQLDETLTNVTTLLGAAGLPAAAHFGAHSVLKAYVRKSADGAEVGARLRARLPAATPLLLLQGDICRRELLIEIDGSLAG